MSSRFRIIPATPSDYGIIRAIAHATWPDTFGEIITAEQIQYMLHMMYREEAITEQVAGGHQFLLLLEKQESSVVAATMPDYHAAATKFTAVGYASYQTDYQLGMTKLHKLYVLPAKQGKGFGKALINEIIAYARKSGQQTLRLDVNYQNKAISAYEHLGFQKIERYNTDIGNGYLMEDWRMDLSLVVE